MQAVSRHVVLRSLAAVLEVFQPLVSGAQRTKSGLHITLPTGPAGMAAQPQDLIGGASPTSAAAAITEQAAVLLALLAHCARAHRVDSSASAPQGSAASGGVSAAIRAALLDSEPLQSTLLSLLEGGLSMLPGSGPESAAAGNSRHGSQVVSINGQPTFGTAPGCGQLLRGPGQSRGKAEASSKDSLAPFLPDEVLAGCQFGVMESPAVLALEAALVLWSSAVHGGTPEAWDPNARASADARWRRSLCAALAAPALASQRKHTRRLLLALCGSHSAYRDCRSEFLLDRQMAELRSVGSAAAERPTDYPDKCKLLDALNATLEVVDMRPKCWRALCSARPSVLPWLLDSAARWDEMHATAGLKLARLALPPGGQQPPGSPGGEGSEPHSSSQDVSWLLDGVTPEAGEGGGALEAFVARFVVAPGSANLRTEATGVLRGVWRLANCEDQAALLAALLDWTPRLRPYGNAGRQYFELLSWMVKAEEGPRRLEAALGSGGSQLLTRLLAALAGANADLRDHPHAATYSALAGLVDFEGHFLEGAEGLADADAARVVLPPRLAELRAPSAAGGAPARADTSTPAAPLPSGFTVSRLGSLRAETKYSANSVSCRLTGRFTIKNFTMQVHELKRSRSIASLSVHYCTAPITEISELKHSPRLWKKALSASLAPGQTNFEASLPVPLAGATALMVVLDSFHLNLQEASCETIQCPRCSHIVRDRHGVCTYCHENAYQCRQCRNINYECLDGFLCNECGHSRFGRLDFSVAAAPSSEYPVLEDAEDVSRALVALSAEADLLHQAQADLAALRPPLVATLASCGLPLALGGEDAAGGADAMPTAAPVSPAKGVSRGVAMLGVLYSTKCQVAYQAVTASLHTLASMQRRLRATQQDEDPKEARWLSSPRPPVFPAAEAFVQQLLGLLELLGASSPSSAAALAASGAVNELFEGNLHAANPATRTAATRLLVLCAANGAHGSVADICALVRQGVLAAVRHHQAASLATASAAELELLSKLADRFHGAEGAGGSELCSVVELVVELASEAFAAAPSNPSIAESVLLPCMRILANVSTSSVMTARMAAPCRGSPDGRTSSGDSAASTTTGAAVGRPAPPARSSVCDALPFSLLGLVCALLLHPVSPSVRTAASDVLQAHTAQGLEAVQAVLDNLVGMLPAAAASGAAAGAFFQLLHRMTHEPGGWSGLVDSGLLDELISLLCPLAGQLLSSEYGGPGLAAAAGSWHAGWAAACANVTGLEGSAAHPAYSLHQLAKLLEGLLSAQPSAAHKLADTGLLSDMLLAEASLSALTIGRSKLAADAQSLLRRLLVSFFLPPPDMEPQDVSSGKEALKQAYVQSCLAALSRLMRCHASIGGSPAGDTDSVEPSPVSVASWRTSSTAAGGSAPGGLAVAGVLLELMAMGICPDKPEPTYYMVLDKSPTQEEFIRGSMTANPYSSSEVGPLMRDVKNVVCQTLDMAGLVEDDFGMELLVAGRIISLSLPISSVYERVWKPALAARPSGRSSLASSTPPDAAGPPMVVTYRLQGLDGEATEEMVSELEEVSSGSSDPVAEYAVAEVLAEEEHEGSGGGPMALLLALLSASQPARGCGAMSSSLAATRQRGTLARVLRAAMHLQPCRAAAMRAGGLPCVLRTVHAGLLALLGASGQEQATPHLGSAPSAKDLSTSRAATAATEESLLLVLEQLVEEASAESRNWQSSAFLSEEGDVAAGTAGMETVDTSVLLDQLAECLTGLIEAGHGELANILARVMPFLAAHHPTAQSALLDRFATSLDFQQLDSVMGDGSQQHREFNSFLKLAEELTGQEEGGTGFRRLVLERGIPAAAADYLLSAFPADTYAAPGKGSEELEGGAAVSNAMPIKGAEKDTWQSVPASPSTPMVSPVAAPQSPLPAGWGGSSGGRRRDTRWAAALERPGVPAALRLLTALAKGDAATAASLVGRPELLALLHGLEGCSSEKRVGGLAEGLLEVLTAAGGEGTASSVAALRSSTQAEMRERAQRKREEMLASMGMQQRKSPGGQTIVALSPGSDLAKAMAELEEEDDDALCCMVCREGYKVQPAELLGVYCFCKRTPAPMRRPGTAGSPAGARPGPLYSTVSHFNLIHLACHGAARRADAALRQPKREWEGATRRNGDTLCNNLLPIPGPSTPSDAYAAAVAMWWDNLAALGPGGSAAVRSGGERSGVGAAGITTTSRLLMMDMEEAAASISGSARPGTADSGAAAEQLGMVAADIGALVDRFATGASFSEDARGGGRESNARLLPYLVALGHHAADACNEAELEEYLTAVATFCGGTTPLSASPMGSGLPPPSSTSSSSSSSSSPSSSREVPEACRVMGLALLLQPPRQWAASRRAALWNLLLATFGNYCRAAAAATAGSGGPGRTGETAARAQLAAAPGGTLLEVARPALVTFAVVDTMQRLAKPAPSSPEAADNTWQRAARHRLSDLPTCVAGADELVELLDELADAGSAMEALDILGALAEAMEGGSNAEEFLRAVAS